MNQQSQNVYDMNKSNKFTFQASQENLLPYFDARESVKPKQFWYTQNPMTFLEVVPTS